LSTIAVRRWRNADPDVRGSVSETQLPKPNKSNYVALKFSSDIIVIYVTNDVQTGCVCRTVQHL
jgi:hypothetical protein